MHLRVGIGGRGAVSKVQDKTRDEETEQGDTE